MNNADDLESRLLSFQERDELKALLYQATGRLTLSWSALQRTLQFTVDTCESMYPYCSKPPTIFPRMQSTVNRHGEVTKKLDPAVKYRIAYIRNMARGAQMDGKIIKDFERIYGSIKRAEVLRKALSHQWVIVSGFRHDHANPIKFGQANSKDVPDTNIQEINDCCDTVDEAQIRISDFKLELSRHILDGRWQKPEGMPI